MSHYKLQKQVYSREHKEAIRAIHGFSRCTSTQVYQWQLYYNCSTAKVVNTSQSACAQEHLLPSKSPHSVSFYTTASPRCSHYSTPSTVERRVLNHLTHRMMTSSCVHSSANTNTVPTVRYTAGTKPNKAVTKIGLWPKIVQADHLWLP